MRTDRGLRRAVPAVLAALCVMLAVPAAGQAATMVFGSPLAVPATLDTATDLGYGSPHSGNDTALWNVGQAQGNPVAPAAGQVLTLTLEGCAQPANSGPAPRTQIHFQSLTAQQGGYRVNVTSDSFDIPVCGVAGASGSTRTSYRPTNFCVAAGDSVDFNDEGGYVPGSYPSGVPYRVIGSVAGSAMDSFIGATGNGAVLSPGDTTAVAGFAHNANEELMLQETLGTGPDASPLCPGSLGAGPSPSPPSQPAPHQHPGASVPVQHDLVGRRGFVTVVLRCQQTSRCAGKVTLTHGAGPARRTLATGSFHVPADRSARLRLRLGARALALLPKHHGALHVLMSVTLSGQATVSRSITVRST